LEIVATYIGIVLFVCVVGFFVYKVYKDRFDKKCDVCGYKITDTYYEVHGERMCSRCFGQELKPAVRDNLNRRRRNDEPLPKNVYVFRRKQHG
jgi:hypothetical protein